MAFQVQQINPIDFQPSVAVGVALPFSAGNVFNSTYTTQDALRANLINFFLTDPGERFLNPTFGAGIRSLLFSQMTQEGTDAVDSAIRVGLSTYFPNITLIDLNIDQSQDSNIISIGLVYRINQTNVQDSVVINFQQ